INEDGDINEDLEVDMRPLKNTIIKGVHVCSSKTAAGTKVYAAGLQLLEDLLLSRG
ncbi:hypothetical protein Tco_1413709, partial [Tanacetum coccineum]